MRFAADEEPTNSCLRTLPTAQISRFPTYYAFAECLFRRGGAHVERVLVGAEAR
jgi:glutamyl/glutaminyl-tRNA synthetase